jgi:hypothetical protein
MASISNPEQVEIYIKKTEDMKQYMREYRKKNIEKWAGERTCPECGYTYTASNIGHHYRSKKHKYGMMEKELEKLKEIKEIINKN